MTHLPLQKIELTPTQITVTELALLKLMAELHEKSLQPHLSDSEKTLYDTNIIESRATLHKLDPRRFP